MPDRISILLLDLKIAMNSILTICYSEQPLQFDDLFRKAYSVVVSKYGESLYTNVKEVFTDHLVKHVRPNVLNSISTPNFMKTLNSAWNDYQNSVLEISAILTYMERHYVAKKNIDNTKSLALSLFKSIIIENPEIKVNLQNELSNTMEANSSSQFEEQKLFLNWLHSISISLMPTPSNDPEQDNKSDNTRTDETING